MRTSKEKKNVEKRYYRPKRKYCPLCGGKLKRSYKVWHKYVDTLKGRLYAVSHGYKCANSGCSAREICHRSRAGEELSVPECGYGRDVIIEVGYQRFWQQRQVVEIHEQLNERITISMRQVQNLISAFLALLKAGQPTKITQKQEKWASLGGMILAIDGMQPAKSNPALYVVREVQTNTTLMAEVLESGDNQNLAAKLLTPIKAWGYPVKGIISDAQSNIQLAVANVWPNQPHQNCQFHCIKAAGEPIYQADSTMKTQLKKKLRGYVNRVQKTIQKLPEDSHERVVLLRYTQCFRFLLRTGGIAPFALGGLQMIQKMKTLENSLHRAQKKRAIGYLRDSSKLRLFMTLFLIKQRPILLQVDIRHSNGGRSYSKTA